MHRIKIFSYTYKLRPGERFLRGVTLLLTAYLPSFPFVANKLSPKHIFLMSSLEIACIIKPFNIYVKKRHTTSIITAVNMIRNPKLNAEKSPIYLSALPELCFVYSLKVIRLASEEISVPTPPIFTPSKSSR